MGSKLSICRITKACPLYAIALLLLAVCAPPVCLALSPDETVVERYVIAHPKMTVNQRSALQCLQIGVGKFRKDNPAAGIASFTQAIKFDPRCEYAYVLRGIYYEYQEDYAASIRDYSSAIALNSTYVLPYRHRAGLYLSSKQTQKGIDDLKRAVILDPRDQTAYLMLARTYEGMGRLHEAVTYFNQVMKFNHSGELLEMRGAVYEKLGDYESAIRDYSDLLAKDDDEEIFFRRGQAYAHLGKYQRAIDDYSKSIEIDHLSAPIFLARASAYEKTGRHDLAEQDRRNAAVAAASKE